MEICTIKVNTWQKGRVGNIKHSKVRKGGNVQLQSISNAKERNSSNGIAGETRWKLAEEECQSGRMVGVTRSLQAECGDVRHRSAI